MNTQMQSDPELRPVLQAQGQTLVVALELCSDACFSSGLAGRSGDVELEAELNADTGLPVLRGRTLKGLLREALDTLVQALEPEGKGAGHQAVQALFGQTKHGESGVLHFSDGSLRPDLVAWVQQNLNTQGMKLTSTEVREALTTFRHQTRIDPITGTAELDTLRATRVLKAGLILWAPIRASRTLSAREQALLAAAALSLRQVGIHRSRGWGRVETSLWESLSSPGPCTERWFEPLKQALERSEEDAIDFLTSPLKASSEPSASPMLISEEARSSTWNQEPPAWRVPVLIRLKTPVVFGEKEGDANTVSTLPYVPGSALLGAVAQRLLREGVGQIDPNTHSLFQQLFVQGAVRWPNLLPVGEAGPGRRYWPQPVSLQRHKESGDVHADRIRVDRAALVDDDPDSDQEGLRPARDGFVSFQTLEEDSDSRRELYTCMPQRQLRVHHQRDRQHGRPTEGNIFSIESLEPDQCFFGEVLCATQAQAEEVVRLLNRPEPLTLGRSRSASYGAEATLEQPPRVEAIPENEGASGLLSWEEPPESLVITLLSDYLGLNPSGLPDPGALVPELLEALELQGIPEQQLHRFLRPRMVRGYVGAWRMPRPRWPGVAAGSVVVLDLQGIQFQWERLEAALHRLHRQGLGERQAEGFGRVGIGLHGSGPWGTSTEWISMDDATRPRAASSGQDGTRQEQTRQDQTRLSGNGERSTALLKLQQALVIERSQRACVLRAREHAQATSSLPSPALIARLQSQVRASEDHSLLVGLLNAFRFQGGKAKDIERTKRGRTQLERARILNRTLVNWIGELGSEEQFLSLVGLEHLKVGLGEPALWTPAVIARLRRIYLDAYFSGLRQRAQAQRREGAKS